MRPSVIVGGGPAGASAARALAERGHRVLLFTAEADPPYDRTVLTKSALSGAELALPPLWPEAPWRELIEVRTGAKVQSIDPDARTLTVAGESIGYRRLLLATGARPRRLPGIEGALVIRTAADLRAVRAELHPAELHSGDLHPVEPHPGAKVFIVGGGVIGLEAAASLRQLGHEVEVLEAGPRILGRGVPEAVAQWLHDLHTSHGVIIRTGAAVEAPPPDADLTIVGVGVVPEVQLAEEAGIACADGICTDRSGRTSAPDVFAAGDCARWDGVRLESYVAAGEQGDVAGRVMAGEDVEWTVSASNWSDQYDATLQAAGQAGPADEELVCRGAGFVLVLTFAPDDPSRLTSACGVGHGPAAVRPVRAAQQCLATGGRVDREALRAVLQPGPDGLTPATALRDLAAALRSRHT